MDWLRICDQILLNSEACVGQGLPSVFLGCILQRSRNFQSHSIMSYNLTPGSRKIKDLLKTLLPKEEVTQEKEQKSEWREKINKIKS